MSSARANIEAAAALVDGLLSEGVRDACVAPGSRSAPLALALAHARNRGLRLWMINDERCAGYFAIGVARASGRPVAIVTTSGTAAANLAPAVAEACNSGDPIVCVTADRPRELRDCGAPQTILQAELFGRHVRWSVDAPEPDGVPPRERHFFRLGVDAAAAAVRAHGPVHLNLPFREPLWNEASLDRIRSARHDRAYNVAVVEAAGSPRAREHGVAGANASRAVEARDEDRSGVVDLARRLATFERGVVVCGPEATRNGGYGAIAELAASLGWPLLADPLSGLRSGAKPPSLVDSYDALLRDARFAERHRPSAVVRFGAMPTSKALVTWLRGAPGDVHVVVSPRPRGTDPYRLADTTLVSDPVRFARVVTGALDCNRRESAWLACWMRASGAVRSALDRELAGVNEPFEGTIAREVFAGVPNGGALFVGNSMPIRDIDTFAGAREQPVRVFANRGASGIDGVTSSALGVAAASSGPVALLTGDLSFLHDVGALQIAMRFRLSLVAVVINNDGGGVFSFLERPSDEALFEELFATPHGLRLDRIAVAHGAGYAEVTGDRRLRSRIAEACGGGGLWILEAQTDRARNVALHRRVIERALADLPACNGGHA